MGGAVSAIAGPVLGTVGGLISGGKAADAAKGQAEALRAAADKASGMAAFTPYGMTTAFGTSSFQDGKGSYTLSPELQAIQQRLFGQAGTYDPTQLAQSAQPLYGAASNLFNIGGQLLPTDASRTASPEAQALAQQYYAAQRGLMPTSYETGATPEAQAYAQQLRQTGAGYLSQSPEEARAEYMRTQQAALAPGQEQQLASLRNQVYQTGRGGLATGGTEAGGLQATNPEMAAYYNSLANTNRQIAAGAESAAQQRQALGLGMLGQGLTAQQQSEATQRQNMLQNVGLSLGYGTQALGTGTTAEEQARAKYAEDLRLGAGLFGTGGALLGQVPALTTAGYSPLQTQLGLLGSVESMGQQPYGLSIDLANQYANAGARQGQLYLQPQAAAANAYSQYQGYSPMGTALSGLGSSMGGGGGGATSWFSNLLGSGTNRSVDINTMPTSNWASGQF
jgi:hypothetical protein